MTAAINSTEAGKRGFFFNDTATTEIYTLSLHDALPICSRRRPVPPVRPRAASRRARPVAGGIRRGSASRRPPLHVQQRAVLDVPREHGHELRIDAREIGRASCRERV